MKKSYTTPSNLYKKERLIVSICLGILLIIFFTFLVCHQEKSRDIGNAIKREHEVTTIYDEPVPLLKLNTSQTNIALEFGH